MIMLIIIIIALGMFAINQLFKWIYSIQLLSSPCELCEKLNNTCSPKATTINIWGNLTGQFVMPKGW